MRSLIAIIVIVYLVGIGVALAPTFEAKWNTGTAAELFNSTVSELPYAVAWPVRVYHRFRDEPAEHANS